MAVVFLANSIFIFKGVNVVLFDMTVGMTPPLVFIFLAEKGLTVSTRHVDGNHYSIADIVAQCVFLVAKATGTRIPLEHKELTRGFSSEVLRPFASV